MELRAPARTGLTRSLVSEPFEPNPVVTPMALKATWSPAPACASTWTRSTGGRFLHQSASHAGRESSDLWLQRYTLHRLRHDAGKQNRDCRFVQRSFYLQVGVCQIWVAHPARNCVDHDATNNARSPRQTYCVARVGDALTGRETRQQIGHETKASQGRTPAPGIADDAVDTTVMSTYNGPIPVHFGGNPFPQ